MKAYDCVQASRAKGRPTALSYIGAMIDGFVEMHGDRRFGDDPAAMKQAGIAYATEQIIDLIANGVSHVHIYTMNQPDIAGRIIGNLTEIFR